MKVKVRCIKSYYDLELKTIVTNSPSDKNYERIIKSERAKYLEEKELVKILEVIQEQKKEKAIKPMNKVEKR